MERRGLSVRVSRSGPRTRLHQPTVSATPAKPNIKPPERSKLRLFWALSFSSWNTGISACLALINIRHSSSKKDTRSEEPPLDTNGKVTPVRGNKRRLPAMIRMLCPTKCTTNPIASRHWKVSADFKAVRMPRLTSSASNPRIPSAPRSPVSSVMAEKIKSDWAIGTRLGLPIPTPRPINPPFATARSDCTIW